MIDVSNNIGAHGLSLNMGAKEKRNEKKKEIHLMSLKSSFQKVVQLNFIFLGKLSLVWRWYSCLEIAFNAFAPSVGEITYLMSCYD